MTPTEIKAWILKQPYQFYDGLYLTTKRFKFKDKKSIPILKSIENCIVDDKKMEFYLKRMHVNPDHKPLFESNV